MNKRVLITGAAGQLGSRVVRTLTDLHYDIIATDRRTDPVGIVSCELSDLERLTSLCQGMDAVVHLATSSPAEPDRPRLLNRLADNLRATTNVARACRATGVRRLVYASSIQVIAAHDSPYVEVAYLPLDSNSPPNPRSHYGLAKLAEETLLRELCAGPECGVVCLRLPRLFHQIPGAPVGLRLLPLSKEERPAVLAEGLSCLSFQDAATLIAACLEADLSGHRVYLPAVSVVAPELVPTYVARLYPGVELRVPVDRLRSLVDLSDLERDLGWRPVDLPLQAPPPEAEVAQLEEPPPSLTARVVERIVAWHERLARARRRRWAQAQMAKESRPMFSADYVSAHAPNWIQLFHHLQDRPDARFLVVGGHDGRSVIWLLKNVLSHPSARLTTVGSFGDPVLELRFDHSLRVSGSGGRVIRLKGHASSMLPTLPSGSFDAVYLDGSYSAPAFHDAVTGWDLVKPGGTLLFDGYFWEKVSSGASAIPAIGSFLEMIGGRGEVLHRDYQLAVRKR